MAEKSGVGDQIKSGMEWGCNYFQPTTAQIAFVHDTENYPHCGLLFWFAPFSTAYLACTT